MLLPYRRLVLGFRREHSRSMPLRDLRLLSFGPETIQSVVLPVLGLAPDSRQQNLLSVVLLNPLRAPSFVERLTDGRQNMRGPCDLCTMVLPWVLYMFGHRRFQGRKVVVRTLDSRQISCKNVWSFDLGIARTIRRVVFRTIFCGFHPVVLVEYRRNDAVTKSVNSRNNGVFSLKLAYCTFYLSAHGVRRGYPKTNL